MNLPSNASTTALNARTFLGAWTNPKNAAVARHSVTTKPKSTSKAIGIAANAPKLSGGKWKKNKFQFYNIHSGDAAPLP